jgi:hypothetical protein
MEVALPVFHGDRPDADRRADRRGAGLSSTAVPAGVLGHLAGLHRADALQAFAGHYTLLAIPFFILASTFMSTGGVAQRIIRFPSPASGICRAGWPLRGLRLHAVRGAVGLLARHGGGHRDDRDRGHAAGGLYQGFAAGVICNAGTLGILIPPSIVMVVYAGRRSTCRWGGCSWRASSRGFWPGFMLMIGDLCHRQGAEPAQGRLAGWGESWPSGRDAAWGLFLIVIILGGIYGGIFTPTEAAAVAAVYAFFIACFVYRDMGPLHGKGARRQPLPAVKKALGAADGLRPPRHQEHAVRGGQADGHADVHHRQRADPEACADRRADPAADRGGDARRGLSGR